jgi:hypothetical protein
MTARRTEPGNRNAGRAPKARPPRSGPARRSTRRPQGGAVRGAVEGEVSRPVSMLPDEAEHSGPEPGALRPLARALIELAVALRSEDEKGAGE